ncbi:MAG: hypothetical protein SWO11_20665 [Thermodesulfobacteriota bacterium]|nr:hypothetical protein [Thermodesulfobacteriota bacterium]
MQKTFLLLIIFQLITFLSTEAHTMDVPISELYYYWEVEYVYTNLDDTIVQVGPWVNTNVDSSPLAPGDFFIIDFGDSGPVFMDIFGGMSDSLFTDIFGSYSFIPETWNHIISGSSFGYVKGQSDLFSGSTALKIALDYDFSIESGNNLSKESGNNLSKGWIDLLLIDLDIDQVVGSLFLTSEESPLGSLSRTFYIDPTHSYKYVMGAYAQGWLDKADNTTIPLPRFDIITSLDVADTLLTLSEPCTIDIHPGIFYLKSKGKFVTLFIELPQNYDVADIDSETIALVNIDNIPLDPPLRTVDSFAIGDYDKDGIQDLKVRFDRKSVLRVSSPGRIKVIVNFKTYDGTNFVGVDAICVIGKRF